MHGRTKHIQLKYQYIWEKITDGPTKISFIPTEAQLADVLSKRLSTFYHNKLQRLGRLQEYHETPTSSNINSRTRIIY